MTQNEPIEIEYTNDNVRGRQRNEKNGLENSHLQREGKEHQISKSSTDLSQEGINVDIIEINSVKTRAPQNTNKSKFAGI